MVIGPWSVVYTDECRKDAVQIEPVTHRFTERFAAVRRWLETDPTAYTFRIGAPPPDRRVIFDRGFADGFELAVGFQIDHENRTVVLEWMKRAYVGDWDYLDDIGLDGD